MIYYLKMISTLEVILVTGEVLPISVELLSEMTLYVLFNYSLNVDEAPLKDQLINSTYFLQEIIRTFFRLDLPNIWYQIRNMVLGP